MTETIKGSVVLITGATGAIAQALIAGLVARGAARIYAAARDPSALAASPDLVPIRMDVTSDDDVAKAAAVATDVTLLINNAGINRNTGFMVAPDLAIAREEIEANYLAPLRVTRAFAPALIKNHGAVLNLLTILARVNLPFMGSYCAVNCCQGSPRRCGAARRGRYKDDRGASDPENDNGGCGGRNPRWLRGR
jgi:NAD(P)-dependent dehydrogenase (short-subunit alcohol dehydrogenase family)